MGQFLKVPNPHELREIENEEISATVKKVEFIGIKSITDGEFRRDFRTSLICDDDVKSFSRSEHTLNN